jgi:hypothetical protein
MYRVVVYLYSVSVIDFINKPELMAQDDKVYT